MNIETDVLERADAAFAEALAEALEEIELLTKESHNMKTRVRGEKGRNRDLQDALETINMLKTAKSVVTAAILRTESRGAHSRLDYPETNPGWQKNIVVTESEDKIVTKTVPVVKL